MTNDQRKTLDRDLTSVGAYSSKLVRSLLGRFDLNPKYLEDEIMLRLKLALILECHEMS